jgi:hypothetical protein
MKACAVAARDARSDVIERFAQLSEAQRQGGYTEEEHRQGWELVLELLGYKTNLQGSPVALRQREATAELDQWDGENFERARAALDHRFPDQSAYVFDNLSAKSGAESIAAVRTFVDRVAALRDGSDAARADKRSADQGRGRAAGVAAHPRRG